MSTRLRGTPMAIACVTTITAALGGMYFAGRDVKEKEGSASMFKTEGSSDMRMTSSDVSAAVSLPKPTKERLSTQPDHK